MTMTEAMACRDHDSIVLGDPPPVSLQALRYFELGQEYEAGGNAPGAVFAYKQSANRGYGPAAKALGDLYFKGAKGVGRDFANTIIWQRRAIELGVEVDLYTRCTSVVKRGER